MFSERRQQAALVDSDNGLARVGHIARLIVRLCSALLKLPSALYIDGIKVVDLGEAGRYGSCATVYRGYWTGSLPDVALKSFHSYSRVKDGFEEGPLHYASVRSHLLLLPHPNRS